MNNHYNQLKDYFSLLKRGFLWMKAHPEDVVGNEAMISRAKKDLFPKGKELGIEDTFSAMTLVFGPSINWDLLNQYKK